MAAKRKSTVSKEHKEVFDAWNNSDYNFPIYDCFEILKTIIQAKGGYRDDYVDWAISAATRIQGAHVKNS